MSELALTPFLLFCLIATATPGPNNMINLAQGLQRGFWPAMPFALGTGFGVGSLLLAVALGLGAAATESTAVTLVMRIATTGYLLYLALKIAASGSIEESTVVSRLGFWGGIGFQWINPKTWASAMAMATTYLPPRPSNNAALTAAAIFCATAWMTQPVWIGFGAALKRVFSDPRKARWINRGLAVLLLAATLPFLWHHQ